VMSMNFAVRIYMHFVNFAYKLLAKIIINWIWVYAESVRFWSVFQNLM